MSDRGRYPAHTDHRLFMRSGVGSTFRRLARTGRVALTVAATIGVVTALAACGVAPGPVAAPRITLPGYVGSAPTPSSSPTASAARKLAAKAAAAASSSHSAPGDQGGDHGGNQGGGLVTVRRVDGPQSSATRSKAAPAPTASAPSSAPSSPSSPALPSSPPTTPAPPTTTAPDPSQSTTDPAAPGTDSDPDAGNTCDSLLGCIVGLL
jgi:hypothetical protein